MSKRLLPFLAATYLLAGCVKETATSVELVGFCAWPDGGEDCSPSAGSCDRYLTGQDAFYLEGALGYFVEVQNNLPENDAEDTGGLNSHDLWVEGSKMSYHVDVSQSASTAAFSLPDDSAGTIEMRAPAGGSATPFLEIIPPATVERLASHIAAGDSVLLRIDVKAKARFGDMTTMDTAPISYWVWIVNAAFGGYVCPDPTEVVTGYCGTWGDGATTIKCEAP